MIVRCLVHYRHARAPFSRGMINLIVSRDVYPKRLYWPISTRQSMKRLEKCILTLSFAIGYVQVRRSYGTQDKHNPYLIVCTQDSTEEFQPGNRRAFKWYQKI